MERAKIRLVSAVILLLVLALLTGTVLAASPFVGVWKSIDPFDGSKQTLAIKPLDGKFAFQYVDKGASICGVDDEGQPLYAATGKGYGTVDGDVFSGRMKLFCLEPEIWFVGAFDVSFTYLPESDTLFDPYGAVWQRTR